MDVKISHALSFKRDEPSEVVARFYDQWATDGDYDEINRTAGYLGPQVMANLLADLVPDKAAKILDIGCGTGLVGEELKKVGFSNVDGLDPSGVSLEACKAKGCYKDFIKAVVAEDKLPTQYHSYDAGIACGVFLIGHCDGASLKTALRVIKPGGFLLIATRRIMYEDERYDLRDVTGQLVADNVCSVEEVHIPVYSGDYPGVALIYTRLR